jgi:creatinine amidohydrolase/Fe(II)-dependent formamide hydrolase-like protein
VSLARAGFTLVCFVGDHGASQAAQERVAARLTEEWRAKGVRVLHVSDYYDAANGQVAWLESQGETRAAIGDHAGIRDTSELLWLSPELVRTSELAASRGRPSGATGVDGEPWRASAARGKRLLELKVEAAVRQIRRAQGP